MPRAQKEVTSSVKKIFAAARAPIIWEQFDVTGETEQSNTVLLQAIDSLRRNKVGLKGTLYTPISKGHTSFNGVMRKQLDMYASVVKVKNIEGVKTRHKNIDMYIVRENTEGEYAGLEHKPVPDVVESIKITSKAKSERISRYAFDLAIRTGKKKIVCVHKANIMKLTDGLFLSTFREIAEEYKHTGIQAYDMIVDNTAMQLVGKPQQFDIMVTSNLYGNIVTNICAGLINGVGTIPGANVGRNSAVFEPGARHVGKDIQGQNVANPTAMLSSGILMLRHLDLGDCAQNIENALHNTYLQGKHLTRDMGGSSSCQEFTDAVIENLGN
ncbi:Isocitrate dehydrogenase [NAD] subunit 1, mitochondrial [Zancudomyces culisetae]|uniref:Isocitrate dehydrogenase [NAD] subunit 1, mitochondrial n=1 Tax=Zancudomyces culisetae TaxID=1213189 RepID=A0A1R1PWW1_ZANCU|nr:Isocitrate dehydrogenase [NAD] subunit 1, mitochondrial [Zancudomyces culisetae]|eukprot:OMH85470.1 Isocitrate dehydrogenase [NAD] subunit 1, mitochondrial [Zancudomyces culisetae]